MMGEMKKFQVALVVVLACVSMWGCSEDKVRWHEGFVGSKVVGFLNDSLVIVGSHQQRTESHEGLFEPYWDTIESGHERLCVYNYRVQESGPRWCSVLDELNETNAFRGQMTDSIIWGGDMLNSIRLWKVGETQHEIKLRKKIEGCSKEFGIVSVKQWLDGTFFARGDNSLNVGSDSCQYAVLDTMEGILTYKRLNNDLEWIKTCDDIRAWGDDVYCLVLANDPLDLFLKKNDKVLDSLLQGMPYGWTEYTKVGFVGNILNLGNNVCEIVNDNFRCVGISIRNALEYKYKDGTSVIY
ncbi:MAG: hypothetical protein SPL52_15225 [Fibrobacter sp.]|nr:hypothetical protein [Fibrobacter sp.]